MNTVEERLRAALTAKSDGVTQSMLRDASPPWTEAEEVSEVSVLQLPRHRLHRSRRVMAVAVAVAAMVLVAVGAAAVRQATTSSSVDPAHLRPRSAVPWDQVGPGWTLLQDAPHTKFDAHADRHPDQRERVLLIDPHGVKYLITTLAPEQWMLRDWSARTERVLFLPTHRDVIHPGQDSLVVFDLRAGTGRTIRMPAGSESERFSGPQDQSILFGTATELVTYSLTGQLQARFTGVADVPTDTVDSPDGTQIITGGKDGLIVRDAQTGRRLRTLHAPNGFSYCNSQFWEPHGELVARCTPTNTHYGEGAQWFMFSQGTTLTDGRADPRLTQDLSSIGLRQGYIEVNPNAFAQFSREHTKVTRLDGAGYQYPVAVPSTFNSQAAPPDEIGAEWLGWSVESPDSGVDTLNIAHTSADGRQDALDSWDPFSGTVTELYRAPRTGVLVTYSPWHQPHG